MAIKVSGGRTCAEAIHTDKGSVFANPAVPAEPSSGFHADPWRTSQHRVSIEHVLLFKELPARHRDNRRLDVMLNAQDVGCGNSDLDFRTGRQQGYVAVAIHFFQDIGTASRKKLIA